MKFKIKNVNVSYKMGGLKEGFLHDKVESIDNINEISVENLKEITLNQKKYEAMKKEFKELDAEILGELRDFIEPKLASLKNEILETPVINEIMLGLKNKIKELKEAGKDNYENMEGVIAHTQVSLLQVMKQNKVGNGGGSSIGGGRRSIGGNKGEIEI